MNVVNALDKIPGIIAQYEERTAKLKADIPHLEAIISKPWGKEDELKQLKSELAALDRKITAELVPKLDENAGNENKQEQSRPSQSENKGAIVDSPSSSQIQKSSLVAEPYIPYPPIVNIPRFASRRSAI